MLSPVSPFQRLDDITYLLALGVSPLFVARQTGTSLEMIEAHYGGITTVADEIDDLRTRKKPKLGTYREPSFLRFPITRSVTQIRSSST